jgi:hypothetical protein
VPSEIHLDFTYGETLDSRVTASGGTNGTRVNSSGVIVAAVTPRFDYGPLTLAAKGLLIEEARENKFLKSEDLATTWGCDSGTVQPNVATGIGGAMTADKLKEGNTNTYWRVYQTVTLTAAVWSMSFYAKPDGRNWLFVYADLGLQSAYVNVATRAVGTLTGTPTVTFEDGPSGFTRVIMTFTNTTVAAQNVQVWLASANGVNSYAGDNVSGCYLTGFQMELGSKASSYIPTTTTAVTRTADAPTMTGSNFSDWFNPSAGTFFAEVDVKSTAYYAFALAATDGSNNEAHSLLIVTAPGNGPGFQIQDGGVSQANINTGTPVSLNAVHRIAGAFALNDFALAADGVLIGTDTSGTLPTPTALYLGHRQDGLYLNGHIRSIKFYPRRLPSFDMVGISSLDWGTPPARTVVTAHALASGRVALVS